MEQALYRFESNLYLVLSWAILAATISLWYWAVRRKQHNHLFWIIPWFVNNAVEAVYRTLTAFHLLRSLDKSIAFLIGQHLLIDISDICMALGTFMLLHLVKSGRFSDAVSETGI